MNAQAQFRSKEISKSSVVDGTLPPSPCSVVVVDTDSRFLLKSTDMVEANHLLYKPLAEKEADSKDGFVKGKQTEHPDHCVVIK